MGIFKDTAPKYWARNLPVIPLKVREKRPAIDAWSQYGLHMPTEHEQEMWLGALSEGNIGLPAGPASGLCFLDIDTDDPKAIQIINSLVPKSPWVRIGAKGLVAAYRYTGHKAFQINMAPTGQQKRGPVICELLSIGRQVVLPPSIHPDTKRPYEANCELLDVLDQLPILPKEIEGILRAAFEDAGFTLSHVGHTKVLTYVAPGARDNQITAMAGLYANAITRGERSLKQAIDEFRAWHGTFVEKVAGDDIPVEKGVERIVHFINRDLTGPKKRTLPKGWDEGLTPEEKASLGLELTEEQEEWSFDQLRDYMRGEFDLHADSDKARMEALNYALDRIHRSPTMDELHREALLDWMAQASRLPISKTILKKRLRDMKHAGLAGENQTELAQAVLKDYGDLRYHHDTLWKWAGSHWEEVDNDVILRFIAENYGHLPAAKKAADHVGILKVLQKLTKKDLKSVSFDGVNFANGVLGSDLVLREHDPVWGMTYTLPFRYMPAGTTEYKEPSLFFKFLADVWGHCPDFKEKCMALQEALCVTLFNVAAEYQRAFLLFGLAHSGKSQLLNIARSLVPEDKLCAIPPDAWEDKFAPAQMHGKLLNFGGELSESAMIRGDIFKKIVEGEMINAQNKGSQIFHFRPKCAQWFASNYLPKSRDTSEGFNRRWLILCFDKAVDKSAKQVGISNQIIIEEREAIVAWAVQALPRIREMNDYTLPSSHERAVNEMAGENDSVRFFIQASGRVRIAPRLSVVGEPDATNGKRISYRISAQVLHQEYSSFCITLEGARPVGFRKFCQRMRELGSVLGFNQLIERGEMNMEEVLFDGLIVRDAQNREMSRSIETNSTSISAN